MYLDKTLNAYNIIYFLYEMLQEILILINHPYRWKLKLMMASIQSYTPTQTMRKFYFLNLKSDSKML